VVSGHDHHDYESVVTSPDGKSSVNQLITASDSTKFYTPTTPVSANDTPIRQDLGRVAYYIVTVDGPEVTIDYYGDTTGNGYYGVNGGTFNFVKMTSTTYSLNGSDKVVAEGQSYVMSDNTGKAGGHKSGYKGTSMSILSGINGDTSTKLPQAWRATFWTCPVWPSSWERRLTLTRSLSAMSIRTASATKS
jgi:hypothetical protein